MTLLSTTARHSELVFVESDLLIHSFMRRVRDGPQWSISGG